jgi:hypothetical protein
MKKMRYPLIGGILLMLVLSSISSFGTPLVDNKNADRSWGGSVSMGPVLEVTTDKSIYTVGEPVTTFLTNVGDETLSAGGPIITIYNDENEIVYQEATYCWYELDPGEYIQWLPWDQTDQQGQQVPVGRYIVEGFLSGGGENYVDDATFYILSRGVDNAPVYISGRGDELDQSQTNYDENCPAPVGYYPYNTSWNISIAQSFTPTKEILTRVVLYVGKNVTASHPYVLAIRENLTGGNLALVSVRPDEFMVLPNLSWIEFDFDDLIISIGETYYIVSYTSNVTNNTYLWGANCSDIYPNGTAYASFDGGKIWWTPPHADMCFMTYGRNNQPPDAPTIDGQTRGKVGKEYEYTFNATDPNDDDVKYCIDWGDNTTEWTRYNPSGTDVKVKHTWSKKGDYTIRAKAVDVYDAESGWGTLDVTMPKSYLGQNDASSPLPHFGVSIVFFAGNANVYEYNDTAPRDLTVRPQQNKIRWFCFGRPWFSSADSGYVVTLHNYRGMVRPQPIVEGDNISFLFVVARDVIVALP